MEALKALLFGILEGITEWLPVSSTGHLILLNEFLKLNVRPDFWELFEVFIQLGAILAVIFLYFPRLCPFSRKEGKWQSDKATFVMWAKIAISCVPAAVLGLLADDWINAHFYNWQTVSCMLILFGIAFLVVEKWNKTRTPHINSVSEITYRTAFYIGMFQLIAAALPGTSRSGATIVGALLLGVSRTVAAEYTFFLAVPVMIGASGWKLLKFGFDFTPQELLLLTIGFLSAFVVSVLVIRFLMQFIKKHDFTAFGWYRIALGLAVILYFVLR
jgi:undecaprenyl-diphosphatase